MFLDFVRSARSSFGSSSAFCRVLFVIYFALVFISVCDGSAWLVPWHWLLLMKVRNSWVVGSSRCLFDWRWRCRHLKRWFACCSFFHWWDNSCPAWSWWVCLGWVVWVLLRCYWGWLRAFWLRIRRWLRVVYRRCVVWWLCIKCGTFYGVGVAAFGDDDSKYLFAILLHETCFCGCFFDE